MYATTAEEAEMRGEGGLRFRAEFLYSCMLVFFILTWWGGEGMAGQHTSQGQTTIKLYKNEKYGYTVQYPPTWFSSGIVYGNAFEIRNYEPKNPQARAAQDRASLLILDMPMGSSEETSRFLNSLLAQKSNVEREVKAITIDGHGGVRVKQRLKAQELGPGVARSLSIPSSVLAPSSIFHISTYLVNGTQIIHLWGKVPVEAVRGVIDEIIQIQEGVTFERQGEIR